jgi:carboxyl-terminal processing protease
MVPIRHRPAFLVLFIVLGCGIFAVVFGQRLTSLPASEAELRQSLQNFAQVYETVEQNYAEPVDPNRAIYEGAIPGMLRVLDPHSAFFDPKAYADLQEEQTGKYYGVGMTIGPRDSRVVVIAPAAGSPAYRAGIRPGDIILSVDGKPTDAMTTADVAEKVRGPRGTTVQITIMRKGAPAPLQFTLTRAEIPRDSIDVQFMVRPGVGYVHINMFNETTDRELQSALDGFGDLQGLVLDLRHDPGGLLTEAIAVSDKFLPKGAVIVSQHGRASPEKVYRALHGNNGKNYPIVVLVDRGTASAAEIVSGAIQDHDRGLIVGENTFGKGLVQTVFPLSDNTGLALTTAKYYTPSGRSIQRNYEGISLYDYYYNNRDSDSAQGPAAPREIKYTDSGRSVYGGDGITPDVKIAPPKPDALQDALLQHYVFFDFVQEFARTHPITAKFQVNDDVLGAFRKYLQAQNIAFSEADFTRNLEWVKTNIRTEALTDQFGLQAGLKARAESDPEIRRAVELLPQALALQQNAAHAMADRAKRAAMGKP